MITLQSRLTRLFLNEIIDKHFLVGEKKELAQSVG